MIQFVTVFVFCLALNEQAHGKITEEFIGEDGYKFNLNFDDCDSCEDKCLSSENSKKISDAVLDVIHSNEDVYSVLKELKIILFMYDGITYEEFADNIKENDFEYAKYKKLQKLVKKYKVCQKICKVYFHLRQALREHAADANVEAKELDDGMKVVVVTGNLVVLDDVRDGIENLFTEDPEIVEIRIRAKTFIVDSSLRKTSWHGKTLKVHTTNFHVATEVIWDVTANLGEYERRSLRFPV